LTLVRLIMPGWGTALRAQVRGDASSLAATAWMLHNVPRVDITNI